MVVSFRDLDYVSKHPVAKEDWIVSWSVVDLLWQWTLSLADMEACAWSIRTFDWDYCVLLLLARDYFFGYFSRGIHSKVICSRHFVLFQGYGPNNFSIFIITKQHIHSLREVLICDYRTRTGQDLRILRKSHLCFNTKGDRWRDVVLCWIIYYFILTRWMKTSSLHGIYIYRRWMGDV
jgi:hypothetical protein